MPQPVQPASPPPDILTPQLQKQFAGALDRIRERVEVTLSEADSGFPHYADGRSGTWTRTPGGDWTGGFWVGQLWLLAHTTGEEHLIRAARHWSSLLQERADSDTIFRGFLFWYGSAIGAVLLDDDAAADHAVRGAQGLHASFNDKAGLMPLGDAAEEAADVGHEATNIDGVPGGTPLLQWAAARTGAEKMALDAGRHASRHAALCVRDDASVCQSAVFDPATGQLLRRYTHKGFSDDSTWARAQTWAMLGFTQAAAHCGRETFLPTARSVCDWYVERLPETGISFWDFDDPNAPDTSIDTSATAIGAASLLKLAALDPSRAARYQRSAIGSLAALTGNHLTPTDEGERRPAGMLLHGCYNRRIGLAVDDELIWGDYFLLEALLAATGRLDTRAL